MKWFALPFKIVVYVVAAVIVFGLSLVVVMFWLLLKLLSGWRSGNRQFAPHYVYEKQLELTRAIFGRKDRRGQLSPNVYVTYTDPYDR